MIPKDKCQKCFYYGETYSDEEGGYIFHCTLRLEEILEEEPDRGRGFVPTFRHFARFDNPEFVAPMECPYKLEDLLKQGA